MSERVVVHVEAVGRLGNRMIQHMAALALASRLPDAVLSGISLPEWKLYQPDLRPSPERRRPEDKVFIVHRDTPMRMPFEEILRGIGEDGVRVVEIRNYVQHMDNFLSKDVHARVFVDETPPHAAIEADELLINVRGEEVQAGVAPDYVLAPTAYLRDIVAETGLRPVIMGQLTPGPYLRALTEAFPRARLVPSQGAMPDFAVIRSARNIVASVSTFSWLAAWLSNADRVFLPVAGLFSPFQRPDIMMLPLDDDRFRFDLFPIYHAWPWDEAVAQHRSIEGSWRRMSGRLLRRMIEARPRVPIDLDRMARFFDEEFYVRAYADIGVAKAMGHIPSGFDHYIRVGHREGRVPFHVDAAWYCRTYRAAALEIGQGDYVGCAHHYAEIGHERGYRTGPPS